MLRRKYVRKLRAKLGRGLASLSWGIKRSWEPSGSLPFHRELQNVDFSHAEMGESRRIQNPLPSSLHKGKQSRWPG
jgi:hypothetical protein